MSRRASVIVSLLVGLIAFALDRGQKFYQVASACISPDHPCPAGAFQPWSQNGWTGGELVRVTDFFDYVLIWNTGISYGLLDSLPVAALGVIMVIAIIALGIWWFRTDAPLVRAGLAMCIGGAVSNALDRLLYGAVADFFHFHLGERSFYIFNIADAAITLGVCLLILDVLGVGRRKTVAAS
ncbi:signal peptidase II [Paradevosia shaoguanensis]|uniref:Lipoprotein signal peptidase n=1 Tax=Paradevosia shaoguanensis TaxID=1335043 RepID=A0AA41QKY1_9HYPH|nr:signal peptidase II [Paradevosia shaoguanensis]MCF1741595.1 signal peptidase II [Paradevosia shaoguanensis]MCI0126078.1 signal peptidase II [Paradevosia shaoguanensis]